MSFLPPSGDSRRPRVPRRDEAPTPRDSAASTRDARDRGGRHPETAGVDEDADQDATLDDSRRRSLGRALGLTALGTVLPGAGLTLTRRRALGVTLLVLALASVGLLAWYVLQQGALDSALDLASRPALLRAVGAVIVVGCAVWVGSIVLTAVAARPDRLTAAQRGGLVAFTAVMCLAVAAPAALGLWYITAHNAAVGKIFTGGGAAADEERAAATADGPRMEEVDPWAHLPRVNVLLLGSDAGDSREGVRTDSMIVASIDTTTGDSVLFGIPRNLQDAPIPADNPLRTVWPDGYDCGSECLINGIWTEAEALAQERPELYVGDPLPGRTAIRDVIAEVIGQPLHYTVIVNLEGFQDLVDAMGGVDITVQERVPLGGETYTDEQGRSWLVPGSENGWLEVGEQRLTGRQALWYARSRVTSDDFSRMRRQRCVVAAVVQQVDPVRMAQRYPRIVGVAGDNITVDIPQDELPAWADLVQRVQQGTIRSLPFTPENTDVANPDYADLRLTVYRAIHPELDSATATGPVIGTRDDSAPTTEAPTATGDVAATTTPAPDPAEETQPPTDELADVGAVC